jgi:Phage integrase family
VFASQAGTPLDVSRVRRTFKAITRKAGLGENWTPRELRHTVVSLMSDNGVPPRVSVDAEAGGICRMSWLWLGPVRTFGVHDFTGPPRKSRPGACR